MNIPELSACHWSRHIRTNTLHFSAFRTKPTSYCNGRRDRTTRRNSDTPAKQTSESGTIGFVARPLSLAGKPIRCFKIAFSIVRRNRSIGTGNLDPARLSLKTTLLHLQYPFELFYLRTQLGRSFFIRGNTPVDNGLAHIDLSKAFVGAPAASPK